MLQIVLALAAAAGAGAGPERGAIAGFMLGLMYDLATGSPLGLTALVYGLAGFVAGLRGHHHADPAVVARRDLHHLGAAVGEAAVPVVYMLIGQDGLFTTRLFTDRADRRGVRAGAQPAVRPARPVVHGVKRPKWKAMPE